MLKKLLVSLLSALLYMTVAAESESKYSIGQNNPDNNITIEDNSYVFVSPFVYQISDGKATMENCRLYDKLDSVIIPSEIRVLEHVYPVTNIRHKAFVHYSNGLTSINVSNDNPYYSSDEGILYDKNKTVLICAPKGKKGEIKIPSGVTRIEGSAFRYCRYVKNIMISSNVTSIGEWAFSGCYSLTSVNIPSSVTRIGKCAFMWCTSLTSVEISFGLTSIGESVFNGCSSLTSISIPSSVRSIGDGAFKDCFGLTSIEIPSSVISIGDGAFSDCRALTSISIPSSVISIGDGAFSDCNALTSIEIPSSVTCIGENAFDGCENLEIVIDNSKENVMVGKEAFDGCKSVKYLK